MICFLIHLVDVEHQICPVLIELCSIDSTDDFRTEAVTVSSCNFPFFPTYSSPTQFFAYSLLTPPPPPPPPPLPFYFTLL
jgi:hypothetical protein